MDPDVTPPSGSTSPALEPSVAAGGTAAGPRVHAVSSLLLDRLPLLLPLASQLGESQPEFESAIHGSSMAPAIPAGARLRVRPVAPPQLCERGDVIFYLADDRYVVHRVVHRPRWGAGRDHLLTCGDLAVAPDPPLRRDRVLGTVSAMQTAAGWRPVGPRIATGSLYRRAMRGVAAASVIAVLGVSPSAAGRLASLLLGLESAGRAAIRRLRKRRPANPAEHQR
jgi:hypothetical protein